MRTVLLPRRMIAPVTVVTDSDPATLALFASWRIRPVSDGSDMIASAISSTL